MVEPSATEEPDKAPDLSHVWVVAAEVQVTPKIAKIADHRGSFKTVEGQRIDALEVYCKGCRRPFDEVTGDDCAAKVDNRHLIGGDQTTRAKRKIPKPPPASRVVPAAASSVAASTPTWEESRGPRADHATLTPPTVRCARRDYSANSWALAREAAGLFLTAFGLLGVLVALGALHRAAGLSAAAGGLLALGILTRPNPDAPRWVRALRAAACTAGGGCLILCAFILSTPLGWIGEPGPCRTPCVRWTVTTRCWPS
ncbi:hypothetical protein [Streptomyces sp. NPDC005969]|uniref:hypothetical protein n=1 Tax=Streptomyces sp. NPDC005969 TaxID=3156722 RepID=UPI0034013B31